MCVIKYLEFKNFLWEYKVDIEYDKILYKAKCIKLHMKTYGLDSNMSQPFTSVNALKKRSCPRHQFTSPHNHGKCPEYAQTHFKCGKKDHQSVMSRIHKLSCLPSRKRATRQWYDLSTAVLDLGEEAMAVDRKRPLVIISPSQEGRRTTPWGNSPKGTLNQYQRMERFWDSTHKFIWQKPQTIMAVPSKSNTQTQEGKLKSSLTS